MQRAYVNWGDAYGGSRLTWYTYEDGADLAPFSDAIDAVCNPVPLTVVAAVVQTPSLTPSTDPYPNVADSAVLSFVTALGNTVGVICPGFKESLYMADNQTVDPAQPLVIALVGAVLSLPVVDNAGNPVLSFIGGLRQRRGY